MTAFANRRGSVDGHVEVMWPLKTVPNARYERVRRTHPSRSIHVTLRRCEQSVMGTTFKKSGYLFHFFVGFQNISSYSPDQSEFLLENVFLPNARDLISFYHLPLPLTNVLGHDVPTKKAFSNKSITPVWFDFGPTVFSPSSVQTKVLAV